MGFFRDLKNRVRQPLMAPSLPMTMPVDAKQMQQFTKPQGLPPIGPIDRPLSPSIVRPSELPATPPRPIPFGPGHPLFDPPRVGRRGGIGMPRPKKIKADKGLGSIQKFFDRQRLGNIPMQDVPAAPVPFEMDRVPFERPGFAEGEGVDINRIIAEQGARESISPPEMKAQSIREFLGETGRTISNRDAELYGMGLLSFEDVIEKAVPVTNRNLEQQEQLFFPKEEKSFRDFQRAFKGTGLGDFLSFIPDQMQVADYMNYKREQGSLDDLLDDLEKKN